MRRPLYFSLMEGPAGKDNEPWRAWIGLVGDVGSDVVGEQRAISQKLRCFNGQLRALSDSSTRARGGVNGGVVSAQ
jgi:hypothetical protein